MIQSKSANKNTLKHSPNQNHYVLKTLNLGVSKNWGTPKSSILIGFSIINFIHFGGKPPLFLETAIVIVRYIKG